MSQDEWFKKIKEVSLSPFQVTKEFLNSNSYTPGKVRLWKEVGHWDHRTVCENEVIFETDSTYAYNRKFKKQIENALEEEGIPFYTFFSGGKSFHIHCFFNKIKFKNKDNAKVAKKAIEMGFSYREVRKWLIYKVCRLAGIQEEAIGDGKVIDTAPISFSSGKQHLIRAAGGKKQVWDKKNKETRYCHYKTYIAPDVNVDKKPIITNTSDVKFPEELQTFEVDEYELMEAVQLFIERAEDKPVVDMKNFKGKYLGIHGVTKILDGLKSGHRSAGAQVISIACVLDGVSREEANTIMDDYVKACSQSNNEFTLEEAMQWYDWVADQPAHFWNCSLLRNLEVHDDPYCQFCNSQHKEALELLEKKDVLKSVEQCIVQLVAGELKLAMTEYILFNSRHFPTDDDWELPNDPKPQAMIIASDSSSGKSYVTKKVLKLFPEEQVLVRSRLTKSVLNYMVTQNYDGKIIFIEELQGFDESSNQLRLWISEGVLRLNTVENVKLPDGTIVNEEIIKETKGQPVIITTTAQDEIDRELMNRVWILSTDMSKQQTKTIMKFQDKMEQGLYRDLDKEIQKLQDMQREIRPYHFIIPFMDMEVMNIPYDNVKVRRDYKKLIDMVKCVALLYQRQRIILKDKQDREYILCSFMDFHKALQYIDDNMNATFNSLSAEQINLLMKLRSEFLPIIEGDEIEFDHTDIQQITGLHYNKCYTIMKVLVNLGFVSEHRGEHNKSMFKIVKEKELAHLSLPTFDELKNLFDYEKWLAQNDRFQFLVFEGGTPVFAKKWSDFDQKVLDAYSLKKTENGGDPLQKPKTESPSTTVVTNENEVSSVFVNSEVRNKKNFGSVYKDENIAQKNSDSVQYKISKTESPTKSAVIQAIKSSKKNPTPFEEIADAFIDTSGLDVLLESMKRTGDIYEPREGKYIIL